MITTAIINIEASPDVGAELRRAARLLIKVIF